MNCLTDNIVSSIVGVAFLIKKGTVRLRQDTKCWHLWLYNFVGTARLACFVEPLGLDDFVMLLPKTGSCVAACAFNLLWTIPNLHVLCICSLGPSWHTLLVAINICWQIFNQNDFVMLLQQKRFDMFSSATGLGPPLNSCLTSRGKPIDQIQLNM